MHGLVSLLAAPHYELVEGIWLELEKECGLTGVKVTPYPHFSWQIAADYPEPVTEEAIRSITRHLRPFKIHTAGLGIFSGPHPVVFIAIARSPELDNLHTNLWRRFETKTSSLSPYYSSQKWIPHITLIFGETTSQSLMCGLELLSSRPFDWEIEVNNITFVSQLPGQVGTLRYHYEFSKG